MADLQKLFRLVKQVAEQKARQGIMTPALEAARKTIAARRQFIPRAPSPARPRIKF
jgi:hypothetical protein